VLYWQRLEWWYNAPSFWCICSLNEGQEGGFSPASMNLEAKVLSFQEDNVEINKHFLIFCGYEAGRCLLFVCLDG
jgi:hypothetical protein